jgi:hypothetical protein
MVEQTEAAGAVFYGSALHTIDSANNNLKILKMMDWIPIVLLTFKLLVLAIGMFFAIKWHYDQGKKMATNAVLRAGGKVAAIFMLSLLGLGLFTLVLARTFGLDLSFP